MEFKLNVVAVVMAGVLALSPQSLRGQTDPAATGIDMGQLSQQLRIALGEVQAQLSAQQLPLIMQARIRLQAHRYGHGRAGVLTADQNAQSAAASEAAMLFVVPIPEGPVPSIASNPLAQSLESAMLSLSTTAQQLSVGKNSGQWLGQDFTIDFTVSESGSQIAFTPLAAGVRPAANLPVHHLTLTFVVQP